MTSSSALDRRARSAAQFAAFARRALCAALLGFALALSLPATGLNAQEAQEAEPAQEKKPAVDVATVTVDGEDLFAVVGVSARPAAERAKDIAKRIEEVAQRGISTPTPTLQRTEFGTAVYLDGVYITTVTSVDVEYEGLDAPTLGKRIGERVAQAVEAYRERRSKEGVTASLVSALVWTAAFIVFAICLCFCARFLRKRADNRTVEWVKKVEKSTGKIVETDTIVSTTRATIWMTAFLILVLGLYYYLSQVLFAFPGTRDIAIILLQYFTGPVLNILSLILNQIPAIIMLVVIYFITRYLMRLVKLLFQNIELGFIHIGGFERSWTWPTYRLATAVLIVFAVIVAYPYIPGSDTAAFKGITIFLGVILSLGSSSVISNLLSGLFVIYRRSVNVGDWIDVKGELGEVESVTLLETSLRSPKNELISIPNSQLLSSELTNYTRRGETAGLLLHTSVGIGYEEPPEKVVALLLEAADRTEGLKKNPPPFVLKKSLADYAVVYEINGYTDATGAFPRTESDLVGNILDVFNENRVQIMTPSYVADPEEPKLPPETEVESPRLTKGQSD